MGIADFLICAKCGILAAVVYSEGTTLYASVNVRAVEKGEAFGRAVPVSPWKLGVDEKRARWKELWFADVSIV